MNRYTYKVEMDHEPMDPRTDFDNFGEMLCFHKRYTLGDKHPYNADYYSGWDEMLAELQEEDDPVLYWLPVFMHDHSGIVLSTGSFSDPWDSGQLGLIVARESKIKEWISEEAVRLIRLSNDMPLSKILEKDRTAVKETVDLVSKMLKGEVETYSAFVSGDVWGYCIFEVKDHELIAAARAEGIAIEHERRDPAVGAGTSGITAKMLEEVDISQFEDLDHEFDSCWGFFGYNHCVAEAKEMVEYYTAKEHEKKEINMKRFSSGARASSQLPGCQP